MSTDVIMPALGFDMTEGLLARWLKNEGDPVEKGQAIAEIETEKATVEIEAAAAGILARIIVRGGETVPVGTVIGVIAEAGEKVAAAPAPPEARPPAPAPDAGKAAPSGARVKASPVARKMAEDREQDDGAALLRHRRNRHGRSDEGARAVEPPCAGGGKDIRQRHDRRGRRQDARPVPGLERGLSRR